MRFGAFLIRRTDATRVFFAIINSHHGLIAAHNDSGQIFLVVILLLQRAQMQIKRLRTIAFGIADARLQLSATDHSMAEIAQRCGFYDSPHFIRVFKQQVGVTPSVYRKLHAGLVSYAACTIMPDPHAAMDRG